MLPEVDTLPGSKGQPPIDNWYHQAGFRQNILYMRRHIVRPLVGVAEIWLVFRNQPVEVGLEVCARGGIGIFIDTETRRGVPEKDITKTAVDRTLANYRRNLRGNFMQPATARSQRKYSLKGAHLISLCSLNIAI